MALLLLLLLWVWLVAARPTGTAILTLILLLLLRLLLLVLLLRQSLRRHDPVIVFGVLQIVFSHHAVARRVGVTRELEILLIHIRRRTADFYLRSGRVEGAVRIVSTTAAIIVVAAACVLRPAAASA